MPTNSIEAEPESIAAIVASYSPGERARFDAALQNFAVAHNLPADDDYKLTPEDIASIGRGIADSDAGRVHDGDTVLAELRAMVGR